MSRFSDFRFRFGAFSFRLNIIKLRFDAARIRFNTTILNTIRFKLGVIRLEALRLKELY